MPFSTTGRRNPTDYSTRLPVGWMTNLPKADAQWIGQTLFAKKGILTAKLQLWWTPPQPGVRKVPSCELYHLRRLFLWMPRRMWAVDFKCPQCQTESLKSKGIYNRIRSVVDLKDMYWMATEYLYCPKCGVTIQSWDDRLLSQLTSDVRAWFPAILTRKYASVVTLFRARTLGNSSTALTNNLLEVHSEEWLRRNLSYLGDCYRHK